MNLTEEWKLRKEKFGLYYYRDINDNICIARWGELNYAICVEILDKVPSYEEYQRLKNLKLEIYKNTTYKMLDMKNEELRQLLKECQPFVQNSLGKNCSPKITCLLTKIDKISKE